MRKIIIQEFVTLDGVMQAPGAPDEDTSGGFAYGGWIASYAAVDDEAARALMAQWLQPADLLLGRKTYEIFAAYWPEHADAWPGINDVTKYCVSSKPMEFTWQNSELITGDVVERIKELKQSDGSALHVIGSGKLVQTLFEHDLVDEMRLMTHPLTLGTGKKLFAEGTIAASFTLTESLVSSTGVVFANYRRAGEVTTGTVGT